jgi:ABC-type multidrug transport system ATPase subunit
MQDNQLHDNLSVSEAMRFAANLKLAKDCKNKQQIVKAKGAKNSIFK